MSLFQQSTGHGDVIADCPRPPDRRTRIGENAVAPASDFIAQSVGEPETPGPDVT